MKKIVCMVMLLATLLASCNRNAKVQQKESKSELKQDTSLNVCGKLVIGHEVSTFTADGDTLDYWVVDTTNQLDSLYKEAVGKNAKPYTAVHAELKVYNKGKSTDGFAADYDGTYEVAEILKVTSNQP